MRRALAQLSLDDEADEEYYQEGYGHDQEEEEEQAWGADTSAEGAEEHQQVEAEQQLEEVPEDVCAICLEQIELTDLAIVKGCEHQYCAKCILRWASCREVPACPQCKKPFNYLYTHRLLDGSLSDAPVEESVCLLLRAKWFVEHVQVQERGKAVSAAEAAGGEWANQVDYDDYDDLDVDEDDRIEAFYFSSAAGRARVVIGNRRNGENGFMRAGRMYARPALQPPTPNNGTKQKAKAAQKATAQPAAGASGDGARGAGSASSSASAAAPGASSSASSSGSKPVTQAKNAPGRRAQRNAKRAANDDMLLV